MLIAFDGIDSSGKETQSRLLADRLRYAGHIVHTFQTPDYSTPSGQELKLRLQGKLGDWKNTPWQEKMQYFAVNRHEHRQEVISALKKNHFVIYDRYVPSSLAFVTIEATTPQEVNSQRADIHDAVKQLEYQDNQMPHEDLSIFLDLPPKTAGELLEQRKEKLSDEDEYTDHISVQQRLYNEYKVMSQGESPICTRIPCLSGNQLMSPESISELIWEIVSGKLDVHSH